MSNVVNLRTVRKRKQRETKEQVAEDNRIRFGRTKAERLSTAAEKKNTENKLDAKRLEKADDPGKT